MTCPSLPTPESLCCDNCCSQSVDWDAVAAGTATVTELARVAALEQAIGVAADELRRAWPESMWRCGTLKVHGCWASGCCASCECGVCSQAGTTLWGLRNWADWDRTAEVRVDGETVDVGLGPHNQPVIVGRFLSGEHTVEVEVDEPVAFAAAVAQLACERVTCDCRDGKKTSASHDGVTVTYDPQTESLIADSVTIEVPAMLDPRFTEWAQVRFWV